MKILNTIAFSLNSEYSNICPSAVNATAPCNVATPIERRIKVPIEL